MMTGKLTETAAHPSSPLRDRRSVSAALLDAVTTRDARLVAGVSGAGGSGKTVLLSNVEAQFRMAGVEVLRDRAEIEHRSTTLRGAVLIDDAHELSEPALSRVHSLVEQPNVDLVVAYRPWPHSAALRRLAAALEHHRAPVVLGPLSSPEVAASAAAVLGQAPAGAVVERLLRTTGGMPWLVHRVLDAIRDEETAASRELVIPRAVLDQLGYELGGIDREVHELLVALAVGIDLSEGVPAALRLDERNLDDLVARAHGDGLLLPGGQLIPLVRTALLQTTPAYHLRAVQRALVDSLVAARRPLEPVARKLAKEGLRDLRVAESIARTADHALPTDPALASSLYDEALTAGAAEADLAARRAQAALCCGDLGRAGRILDDLFEQDRVPDTRRAVDVFAAVWAARGMLAHSAETYRWLGTDGIGPSAALAAITLIGTGDPEGADRMLAAAPAMSSPTLPAVSVRLMGEGMRASIEDGAGAALPRLVRASDVLTASGVILPLPDTPAALAALVALRSGDLTVAESVLESALVGEQGGRVARPRHLLLRAWVWMQADRPEEARAAITEALAVAGELSPRDELLMRALEVGIARRTDDVPSLVRAWRRAREGILHVPVDLFGLLALEELVVTAARLRESHRMDLRLAEAWELLERLGSPSLWSVPLHWAAVQAAILTDRPADLAPHAAALVRASKESRTAAVLAAAGRAWVSVLAGKFDPAAVEAAARGLAIVGLRWDGSRLAGHAAAHADERRDAARLLACARDLHSAVPKAEPAVAEESRPDPQPATTKGEPTLTAREREVARLMLDGKNYREIGEAIYISPRTVEHHIARMRSRLDVKSRSELLGHLRLALGTEDITHDGD